MRGFFAHRAGELFESCDGDGSQQSVFVAEVVIRSLPRYTGCFGYGAQGQRRDPAFLDDPCTLVDEGRAEITVVGNAVGGLLCEVQLSASSLTPRSQRVSSAAVRGAGLRIQIATHSARPKIIKARNA